MTLRKRILSRLRPLLRRLLVRLLFRNAPIGPFADPIDSMMYLVARFKSATPAERRKMLDAGLADKSPKVRLFFEEFERELMKGPEQYRPAPREGDSHGRS